MPHLQQSQVECTPGAQHSAVVDCLEHQVYHSATFGIVIFLKNAAVALQAIGAYVNNMHNPPGPVNNQERFLVIEIFRTRVWRGLD